ncbi:pilus assembly protein TadG-related protein [Mesorhizobium sp. BAC0120]|uniref:pilus assembly protein TadG-related protein n=1 Tax=Mesorhizobium sp. BAC0120 TaxID=3090670 RepID=UPI00298D2B81|nr:pilus assembly protein TadG-related protein [Mesorhizobium sp. BAC0120]MDW6024085.1 pilus assembly protein TadG-related protein [Mesorhizobium sp. BAC0120]
MFRRFFRNDSGNFSLMTAIAIVPIMGALALAVDYTEMSKQRQQTLNALDAAGTATAHRIIEGVTDDEAKAYARKFFEANLNSVDRANATLSVLLPQNNTGGGTLKLCASLVYKPFFFPTFAKLIGRAGPTDQDFSACSEVRLKNTLEVALVLDNSGSMNDKGTGSGQKRIDLLKDASKQLVDTIAGQAALMKQINKPVQFGLVPFSASVNVGPKYYDDKATWLDLNGLSPVHHENFNWKSMPSGYEVTLVNGVYQKTGKSWSSSEKNQTVTRFSIFESMKYYTNNLQTTKDKYTKWYGCVEARPYPYNIDDTAPTASNPATLFVPMFAPDETSGANNNWYLFTYNGTKYYWDDVLPTGTPLAKQQYPGKYFDIGSGGFVAPYRTTPAGMDEGPNLGCTTSPITPLTDVSTVAGKTAIKNSIDAMTPTGNTNVPEGMAWGWRVLSHGPPFSEGRPETEKGNDKVVIVVTDGANTYSAVNDSSGANNRSTYAALGYAGLKTLGYSTSRIFQGTSVNTADYSSTNYTKAMDQQFATLCNNAKAAGIIVMTVSLDLRTSVTSENKAINALKACASDSRFRKDSSGNPVKLYWNTTGGNLSDTFKDIASELSNLRIVG